jgi:hypothetical protein
MAMDSAARSPSGQPSNGFARGYFVSNILLKGPFSFASCARPLHVLPNAFASPG